MAIKVLAEIGIELKPIEPQHYSKFEDLEFEYLITVGDDTAEKLTIPPIKYKHKMHLGFHYPYKSFKNRAELKGKCREIRDEIFAEMDYFITRY